MFLLAVLGVLVNVLIFLVLGGHGHMHHGHAPGEKCCRSTSSKVSPHIRLCQHDVFLMLCPS